MNVNQQSMRFSTQQSSKVPHLIHSKIHANEVLTLNGTNQSTSRTIFIKLSIFKFRIAFPPFRITLISLSNIFLGATDQHFRQFDFFKLIDDIESISIAVSLISTEVTQYVTNCDVFVYTD